MKKNLSIRVFAGSLCLSLAGLGANASAHHSFQATFQADAKIEVEGVVTKFSFKNPHVLTYFEVSNSDGTKTTWVAEGGAATLFRNGGWTKTTIEPGMRVRVSGDATHDGSPMVAMDQIEVLDPKTNDVVQTLQRNLNSQEDASEGNDYGASTGQTEANQTRQPRSDPSVAYYKTPLKLENGQPNVSGGWANRAGGHVGPPILPNPIYNALGQEKQNSFELSKDPQVFCDRPGVIRQAGITPHPFVISQFDDRIVIEYEEYGGRREIFYGEKTPPPGVKTHFGDSVARIKGDTIEIETVNLLENMASPEGTYISDEATTLETLRRQDNDVRGSVLEYTMVVTDPKYLKEPLVEKKLKSLVENYEMIENDCQPPLRERVAVSPYTTFFLTSVGLGDGANLGGLEGADAHCEALAADIGQGGKGWRAFLSTTGEGGVDAIERIGNGPWYNSRGELIGADIGDLIKAEKVTKASVRTERAGVIPGRGDTPNQHDILTGTQNNGTALNNGSDTTCSNWTGNGEGSALVGHFDRTGGGPDPTSWTAAHPSRGCSQSDLEGTGGAGMFYCFATKENGVVGGTFSAGAGKYPAKYSPDGEGVNALPDSNDKAGGLNWFLMFTGAALVLFFFVTVLKRRQNKQT